MINKFLIIILTCILAISCASRDTKLLEASQFILTKNLFIQTGHSDIYFQAAGPIRPDDIKEYEPFCSLKTELAATALTSIEVVADEFTITEIENYSPDSEVVISGFGHRDGVRYVTQLMMGSEKQPFIHSLNCQRWTVESGKRYLNINDIEKIVGNVGKFL